MDRPPKKNATLQAPTYHGGQHSTKSQVCLELWNMLNHICPTLNRNRFKISWTFLDHLEPPGFEHLPSESQLFWLNPPRPASFPWPPHVAPWPWPWPPWAPPSRRRRGGAEAECWGRWNRSRNWSPGEVGMEETLVKTNGKNMVKVRKKGVIFDDGMLIHKIFFCLSLIILKWWFGKRGTRGKRMVKCRGV